MCVSSLVTRICGSCAGKTEGQSLWKPFPYVLLMHLGVSQELLLQGWECALCVRLVLLSFLALAVELQPAKASLSGNWEWERPVGSL